MPPALQPLCDAYHATERVRRREFSEPIALVHLAALADAGFDQIDTIWQRYANRVPLAVRGQKTAPVQNRDELRNSATLLRAAPSARRCARRSP